VAAWFRARGLDLDDDDVETLTGHLLADAGLR
jgi:hypothetical protein